MAFFLFHVGQRVKENLPPHRKGTIVRIYHPGPRATIWVRLDGLGIASFTTGGLSVALFRAPGFFVLISHGGSYGFGGPDGTA